MSELAKAYERGDMVGWCGPELASEAFELVRHLMSDFRIVGQTQETAGRKAMLYQVVRKVFGKDTPNYPQEIGDCTSFGAKNVVEHVECCEILNGDREVFHPVFPPYFYGASRILIGKGRINGDGSSGAWTAAAAQQYGVLSAEEQGVPKYSGSVAKAWGNSGPPQSFIALAKTHPVKSAAPIKSWDDLMAALANYYGVTIASNQGFEMMARSDGFHYPGQEPWPHQMAIIGGDETYTQPYAVILNSWGDVHGHLKDFQNGEDLPIGTLRVKQSVIENMISSGEAYAYSQFAGFPEQLMDKQLFKLI